MKLSEIFERANIGEDEKARRVLNVSRRRASITADEIENGVTIERLSEIAVPVFRYATQVTIHGVLPDFDEHARPAGYKAVFRNSNGSVGVRYVAVDAAKKETIVSASHAGEPGWNARITSTGLEVSRFFEAKDDCIAAFRSFPREFFYGGVIAGAGVLGGYYVFATIGAVRADNLWRLIASLWGIASQEDLNAREAARAAAAEAAAQASRERLEKSKALMAEAKRKVSATMQNRRLTAIPSGDCEFVRVSYGLSGAAPYLYVVRRRGPVRCYLAKPYTGEKTFPPKGKMKALTPLLETLTRDCANGFIFEP